MISWKKNLFLFFIAFLNNIDLLINPHSLNFDRFLLTPAYSGMPYHCMYDWNHEDWGIGGGDMLPFVTSCTTISPYLDFLVFFVKHLDKEVKSIVNINMGAHRQRGITLHNFS